MAILEPLIDRQAYGAARDLGRVPGVRAACVIGSAARGDFEEGSDIDLLALVEDRSTAASVRQSFPRERAGRRVQLKLLDEAGLTRVFAARSTFAVHVLREAVVVSDPTARFATLSEPHSRDAPVRHNGAELRVRLELYEDLQWCQGFYLYCLSDLYSIGRSAAYTILGRESRFEFSGLRALRSLAAGRPELTPAAREVARLRPFFLLVERNASEALPFPYRDRHTEAGEARDACRTLVSAIR